MMSGSGDGGCGDRCGRRCLRDRAFRGGVGIAREKAWGGRHWGGASRVFDVQFLKINNQDQGRRHWEVPRR